MPWDSILSTSWLVALASHQCSCREGGLRTPPQDPRKHKNGELRLERGCRRGKQDGIFSEDGGFYSWPVMGTPRKQITEPPTATGIRAQRSFPHGLQFLPCILYLLCCDQISPTGFFFQRGLTHIEQYFSEPKTSNW